MHERGYTYHGDAPITGLTQQEIDTLMLGFLLKQERREDAMSDDSAEQRQRKRGRKQRARKQFAETGAVA